MQTTLPGRFNLPAPARSLNAKGPAVSGIVTVTPILRVEGLLFSWRPRLFKPLHTAKTLCTPAQQVISYAAQRISPC